MSALTEYRGSWAVVTGGADGIGFVLARSFAGQGLDIAILDIRLEAARAAAQALQTDFGVRAIGAAMDVSDRESCLAGAEILKTYGVQPRLIWLNAGVGAAATLTEGKAAAIEWVIGVNVFGVIWSAQALIPLLPEAGPRHVGVTASSASITPVEGPLTLYGASKQATAAIAEALSAELKPKGIGVTILCPGLLNTQIWDAARARPERFGGARSAPHTVGERWRQAQGADVVVGPALEAIARGGGYCVVPTDSQTGPKFRARMAAIAKGFVP